MVRLTLLVLLFVGAVAGAATAAAHWVLPWVAPAVSPMAEKPQPKCVRQPVVPSPGPRVELVFALDTTGSMGGLLDGAKKKIWSIATRIERGQPKPELKVGLVAYRDKGDAYVTRVTDLTDNLDGIYAELSDLQAAGGGDSPENVRQALNDALGRIQWSTDPSALRIIFLVGDAPPQLGYADVPTVDQLCETAARREIAINTIRCGHDRDTENWWRMIARRAEGSYASIAQDGGVVAMTTPFDGELARAAADLDATAMVYGAAHRREKARSELLLAAGAPAAESADRAACKAAAGRYRADDLVDAVREGKVDLKDLDESALPDELRGVKPTERSAELERVAQRRAEIGARIRKLSEQREEWLSKKGPAGKDAFDVAVLETLRRQAAKKGIDLTK